MNEINEREDILTSKFSHLNYVATLAIPADGRLADLHMELPSCI
jgi:hypothetical protein